MSKVQLLLCITLICGSRSNDDSLNADLKNKQKHPETDFTQMPSTNKHCSVWLFWQVILHCVWPLSTCILSPSIKYDNISHRKVNRRALANVEKVNLLPPPSLTLPLSLSHTQTHTHMRAHTDIHAKYQKKQLYRNKGLEGRILGEFKRSRI